MIEAPHIVHAGDRARHDVRIDLGDHEGHVAAESAPQTGNTTDVIGMSVRANNRHDASIGTTLREHLGKPLPLPCRVDDDRLITAHGEVRVGLNGPVHHAVDVERATRDHVKVH